MTETRSPALYPSRVRGGHPNPHRLSNCLTYRDSVSGSRTATSLDKMAGTITVGLFVFEFVRLRAFSTYCSQRNSFLELLNSIVVITTLSPECRRGGTTRALRHRFGGGPPRHAGKPQRGLLDRGATPPTAGQ